MTKAARAQNVQIPGAETPQDAADKPEEEQGTTAALPPDMQALVQMEVAKVLARQQASRAEAVASAKDLPTQEEALAQVNGDPKRRSILSKDGWVVTSRPIVHGRDESGFAKA